MNSEELKTSYHTRIEMMKATAKGSVILSAVKDLTGDAHKILHYVQDDNADRIVLSY